MKTKYVYHSSSIQGLTEISPNTSTHKHAWVYALESKELSALFLANWSDFQLAFGSINGQWYVCERISQALEKIYKNKKGSIYKLKADNFKRNQTSWKAELVSELSEKVIEETKIADALKFILNLTKQKKLKIYYYPDLPANFPKDKSDLINKAVQWTKEFGEETLDQVKIYHPEIIQKVKSHLKTTS